MDDIAPPAARPPPDPPLPEEEATPPLPRKSADELVQDFKDLLLEKVLRWGACHSVVVVHSCLSSGVFSHVPSC